MSAPRHAATFFALAAYLLAVTVGGWFHTHGGRGCGTPGSGCISPRPGGLPGPSGFECGCTCGHDRGRVPPEAPGAEGPSEADQTDSCPVCHFLAQKPVPSAHAEQTTSAPLNEEVEPAAPIRLAVGAPSFHHSRAPPRLA